jgi:hypothetical protein
MCAFAPVAASDPALCPLARRAIVEAVSALRVASCLIDGEAIACADGGLADFDALRGRHGDVCSHRSPEGNLSVFVGRHGAMKLAGKVRCSIWAK